MRKRYPLRRYLAGAVAARTGGEMSEPALMLAGFALAGSTAAASALLAGLTVSAAVGGPLLGARLDRAARPGRLLAVALLLYAAGLGVVLAGLGRLPFAVTLAIAAATGLPGPALAGGWTAQLPRVAPGDRLPRANALDAMTFDLAGLAGPALAGGAAQALGAPAAVAASAVLVALALPAAWTLPARPGRACPPRATTPTGDLTAGLRVLIARPALARATLASVVTCVAQGMLTACIPLMGERVLGGAGRAAALLALTAVAALAANAVLARRPRALAPDTIVCAGALVQAAGPALAALWTRPGALVVAALVAGIGQGPQLTALFAVRHREAPEHLRSQVFTTGSSLKITGFALGALVGGAAVTRSLPGALALAASTAALAALAFFAPFPVGRPPRPRRAPR